MPVVLSRVDDRLIHGQVLLGWCAPFGVTRIVLVDQEIASHAWEQDLYRMSVPDGIDLVFVDLPEACERLAAWHVDGEKTLVLVGRIEVIAALHAADTTVVHTINLGGVHTGPGRTEILRYLFLSAEERALLLDMAEQGAEISAQDVPASRAIPLEELW